MRGAGRAGAGWEDELEMTPGLKEADWGQSREGGGPYSIIQGSPLQILGHFHHQTWAPRSFLFSRKPSGCLLFKMPCQELSPGKFQHCK